MLSVYFSVHRLQVLCNILPWDFKTHTGLILFVCYMDAYIEFLKALVSRGDCGSERVKTAALLSTTIATNYVETNFYGLRQHRGNEKRGIVYATETKQVHLNGVMFPFLKQREALGVSISVQNDGVDRKQPLFT